MHPELAKFKARMPPRSGLVSVFQYGLSLFFAYLAAVPPEHQHVLAALAYQNSRLVLHPYRPRRR